MKIDLFRIFFRFLLRNKKVNKNNINMNDISNILVISNTAIGDTLFATPSIDSLKKNYPDKKIIALLNPSNYKLFENNPSIDKVLLYNGRWKHFFSIRKKLIDENIDLCFIFHSNEPQATPLAYLSNIQYIIKIPNDNNEFNHLHFNNIESKVKGEHFIDRRNRELEYIGINCISHDMKLFLPDKSTNNIEDFLHLYDYREIIGIQIGASTISRMWFDNLWIELINKFIKNYPNMLIVLTGSPSEFKKVNIIFKALNSKQVINCAGKFNIVDAASLINKFNLFISPDTGPLHIAASLDINTVAISVAGNKIESNPRMKSAKHIFIDKKKTCNPCIDKKCKYQECMLQISPNEVFTQSVNILGEK